MISILTATYNRAHLLPRLYESLLNQSDQNFEWIIVDDGSVDETATLLEKWKRENKIVIRWVTTKNGGKHRAINYGVQMVKGELTFIVDSDDMLSTEAIASISTNWSLVKDDPSFAGVVGLKAYFNGTVTGTPEHLLPPHPLDVDLLSYRMKFNIDGDRAEVFRTSVLRSYPFPEIDKEYFCPEALIWNRIAQVYKMRYFKEKIYFCEYLPDGLTSRIVNLRARNPITSSIYYSELYKYKIPTLQKIKAAINYWRFSFYISYSPFRGIKKIGITPIFLYPFGFLAYILDRKDL